MTSHPQYPQAPETADRRRCGACNRGDHENCQRVKCQCEHSGQQPPPPAWTPPPPKPTPVSRFFSGPDKNLRSILALGLVLIAGWFAATHTTLIYAWKGGSLSQVQSICDSGLGRLSRGLSASGAAECSRIDSLSMWWNVAGFAGLLAAVVAGFLLIYRAQQRRG